MGPGPHCVAVCVLPDHEEASADEHETDRRRDPQQHLCRKALLHTRVVFELRISPSIAMGSVMRDRCIADNTSQPA